MIYNYGSIGPFCINYIAIYNDHVQLQGGKTDEEVSNDQSQETLPYDYDPNLTCPICNKQFHSNQLQLAQQHLKSHPVDSPLTTIQDNDL